jgi:hypothetical protein
MKNEQQAPTNENEIDKKAAKKSGLKQSPDNAEKNDTDIDENVTRQDDYDEVNKNMLKVRGS